MLPTKIKKRIIGIAFAWVTLGCNLIPTTTLAHDLKPFSTYTDGLFRPISRGARSNMTNADRIPCDDNGFWQPNNPANGGWGNQVVDNNAPRHPLDVAQNRRTFGQ
ncbi:MAG: hypothetical protein LBJ95_03960 [Oscillospiraceae bacterium]|nr:hypothetical protein [Oscillospiraceae bacterium]